MKLVSDMSAAEHDDFKSQLWSASSPHMPPTVLPNGSRVEYDRQLGTTVETCADGTRYVLRLGETGLARANKLEATASSGTVGGWLGLHHGLIQCFSVTLVAVVVSMYVWWSFFTGGLLHSVFLVVLLFAAGLNLISGVQASKHRK